MWLFPEPWNSSASSFTPMYDVALQHMYYLDREINAVKEREKMFNDNDCEHNWGYDMKQLINHM